jgi:hypothetical protein
MSRVRERSSKPVKIPEGSKMKHGRVSTYTNLGCGCWRCRRAASEYSKAYRARKAEELQTRVHECPSCSCAA